MDQINPPDEKTPTIKTDNNLVEVLLTPEEQTNITNLRAEEVAPVSDLNNLETTTQSTELTKQTPEKKKLTDKQKKIAAFILSGLILAGIVTGTIFETNKGKGQPIDNPTPTITESSKPPTQTTTSPETSPTSSVELLPTVESLQLDPSLINDPDTLAETLINGRITSWFNAGATHENAMAAFDYAAATGPVGYEEYAKKIASEYDDIYIEALFIPGSENIPSLKRVIDNAIEIHWQTLVFYFRTSFPQIVAEDKVPYATGEKYTKVNSYDNSKDNLFMMSLTEYRFGNEDINSVGERIVEGYKTNTDKFNISATFKKVGDQLLISDMKLDN